MMYEVGCAEVGGFKDCHFVARGHSREDAKQKLWEHGMAEHGDVLSKLSEEERTATDQKIEDLLREVQE
jgi:predicted small metal-binding protein